MKKHPKPGVPTCVKPKALRKLLVEVNRVDGWEVSGTNNHVKVTSPDGHKIFCSSTGNKRGRLLKNVLADLRRIGWDQ